jgi:4-amino-4-deoxy-L-arabinose transferase-like glycosyltransferase
MAEISAPSGRLVAMAAAACVAMTAVQFLLIGRVELTFDEAYYTLWSRRLAWGYLDHPPMVAVWIRASTSLFGNSEFGVRALNTAVLAALPALIAGIAWRLFSCLTIAALAALLWISMPLVAGAPIVTPDAPLVVFWTLGLAALVEVWRGRTWGWLGVGVALGLALLSKFTAAFFGAGILLALLATPSLRRWFLSPAPYAAALLASAIFAPFLIWNAGHGWVTFGKQFGRVPPQNFAPRYVLEFLGSQIGLMNPLTFFAAMAAIVAALRSDARAPSPEEEARRLLIATIAPAAMYFLVHSLHARVQGNWLAPLYPAVAILAADAGVRGPAWARTAARWAPPLGLVAIALIYFHAATGLPRIGLADPSARIGGWRNLAAEVFAHARDENAAFLIAHGYAATSLLTYYGPAAPPVLQDGERARWLFEPPPDEALLAKPGLAFGKADRAFGADLSKRFRHVDEIARLPRLFDGARVQEFALYRVSDPIAPVLAPE